MVRISSTESGCVPDSWCWMRSSLSSGFRMASVDDDSRCTNGAEAIASARIGQATSLRDVLRVVLAEALGDHFADDDRDSK